MVSKLLMANVAASTRDGSGMGASVTSGGEALTRNRAFAMSVARPWPTAAVTRFGTGTTSACQPVRTGQQQLRHRKNAYTTRIAADGGALGSHPARDPV